MLKLLAIGFVSLGALACSAEERTVGQLVVSVDSDMALPDQVDTVRIEVLVRGGLQFANDYRVGQNALLLPATLTLLAGEDPSTPVTVRVIGKKGSRARTLRETTTTIPEGRVAALPMPVQWLCDDRVEVGEEGELVSTCGDGYTCSGGRCIEQEVPAPKLLDYTPEAVFGGAPTPESGSCFDTLGCMAAGAIVEPDTQCRIQAPSGGAGVNVALRVVADGICDTETGACFVPLAADSDDGFREDEGRLTLPPVVCERLHSGRISAVVVSSRCPTRSASHPACGSWSSVTALPEKEPEPPPPAPPKPATFSSLTDDTNRVCCDLVADSKQFYGCVCDGSGRVRVVAIDPKRRTPTTIASFDPMARERPHFAVALAGNELYWIDRQVTPNEQDEMLVQATSLESGETRLVTRFPGDIRDDAELASDGSRLYALASRIGDDGSGAQLAFIDLAAGTYQGFPLRRKRFALDMAQDDDSVYVATLDPEVPPVISRIERVSKQDGTGETISEVEFSDGEKPGYSSLEVAANKLVAISEEPSPDGGTAKLVEISPQGNVVPRYAQRLEFGRGRVWVLGMSGESVVLARSQAALDSEGQTSIVASVLLVPETGAPPRLAIEYRGEQPVGRLLVPEFDPDALYWMTDSGTVYRLSREALSFP